MLAAFRKARDRRRAAQDTRAYRFLVAAPGDATAGITLPANSRLAVSSTSPTNMGDIVVQIGGQEVTVAGGPAGLVQRLSWGERGEEARVLVHPGQATLYVLDEWMNPFAIANTP